MKKTVTVNNHDLTISTKTVHRNGSEYQYYITKINLGTDPLTGRQHQKSFTASTEQDLIHKLERALGTPVYSYESSIPLSSWLNTWLDIYGRTRYKTSTVNTYRYKIRHTIIPELGSIMLKDLTDKHISDFYCRLEKKGASVSRILFLHHILQESLNYAVTKRYIAYNPCKEVPLKKRPYVKPAIFTPEEALSFKKLIENDFYKNILGFMMGTGLRIGEAIGLSWKCVNLEKKYVIIRTQITDIRGESGSKTIHHWQESTKNNSVRKIYLSDETLSYLLDQKSIQNKCKRSHPAVWNNDHDLVFTMHDGSPIIAETLRKHFKNIVTLIGREDLHPHSIRHTVATAAWNSSHNIRLVQDLMGHSTPRTTSHYTQVLEQDLIAQANSINEYMNNTLKAAN